MASRILRSDGGRRSDSRGDTPIHQVPSGRRNDPQAAKAVLEASIDAPEGVKRILEDVSDQYYGVTGWCNLNDAGDRDPLDYDIWKFGTYDWVRIGKWDKYTENVEWYVP